MTTVIFLFEGVISSLENDEEFRFDVVVLIRLNRYMELYINNISTNKSSVKKRKPEFQPFLES